MKLTKGMDFAKKITALGRSAAVALVCTAALCACSESDDNENEYSAWRQRNESYFSRTMAAAGDSIAAAQAAYANSWQEHSAWRKLLCYSRQNDAMHKTTDSVAVEILKRSETVGDTVSPYFTDRVMIAYRTLLMPTTQHPSGLVVDHSGFSSEYSKVFDRTTMSPSTFTVSSLVKGVSTALLYMHKGDRWRVVIPADLAYGSTSHSSIPKYSTIVFEMELVEIYRSGTTPPTWQ